MSPTELIILGVFAMVVAPAILVPLVWAAVLDGRYHAQRQRRVQLTGPVSATQSRQPAPLAVQQAWRNASPKAPAMTFMALSTPVPGSAETP